MQPLFVTRIVQKLERAMRYFMRRHQRLKPVVHWMLGKRYQAQLQVAEWRTRLGAKIAASNSLGQFNTINPENLVWVFGMGRSGNTWLIGMMKDMPFHKTWDEPYIGRLFGNFYEEAKVQSLSRAHFIMGNPIRKGWVRSIRSFVLEGAGYVYPELDPNEYLVIGEHNSSVGAPLIMEAFPDSRMILLVRDPRDIVASNLDGARKGGWLQQWRDRGMGEELYHALAEKDPNLYVKELAERYVHDIGCAKRAYDSHKGRKVLVRYEDLRTDTLGTMQRLYSTLEIPVNAERLERVVGTHSWENIPDKYKGPGQFTRKATPGGWKEDLTFEQTQVVEEITTPLLREYYSLHAERG